MEIILPIILIIIGFILLIKGADFLVEGSSGIAKRFHIPEIIIGLTIVSIGTSLPELLVSVNSAIKGYEDMSLGNIIGSNICNLLLILGTAATISNLTLKKSTRYIEIPLCILYTIIFAFLCNTGNMLTRNESVILLMMFSLFIVYTIVMGISGNKNKEDYITPNNENNINEKTNKKSRLYIFKDIGQILIGIIALKFGGDLIVDNATIIAKYFSISEKVISLTIISIGTSLPELITSVVAGLKGNCDISVGNIIGSNIFNMTFIIGIASFIKPIVFNIYYNTDLIILFISGIVLFLFQYIPPKKMLSKSNGLMYLSAYLLYMIHMFHK